MGECACEVPAVWKTARSMMDPSGGQSHRLPVAQRLGGLALGVIIVLLGLCCTSHAQVEVEVFAFTQVDAPTNVFVGSPISYSVTVSNTTLGDFGPGTVSSEFPTNLAAILSPTNGVAVSMTNGTARIAFPFTTILGRDTFEISLQLQSLATGVLTNVFMVQALNTNSTLPSSTNFITTIAPKPVVDLGIAVLGPTDAFPGDIIEYRLVATNSGPEAAGAVVVTNPLPPTVQLLGFNPDDQLLLTTNPVSQTVEVIFDVGPLATNSATTATVSVVATKASPTNPITAWISAPGAHDTDTNNNFSMLALRIDNPDAGLLEITPGPQALVRQTGFIEQRVSIRNTSSNSIASFRLLVEDLPGNADRLVNAVGTNWTLPYDGVHGTPYVIHGAELPPGDVVALILEYNDPTRQTNVFNTNFLAYPTAPSDGSPRPDLQPVPSEFLQTNGGLRFLAMPYDESAHPRPERWLLEWPVEAGAVYQVVYYEADHPTQPRGSLPLVVPPPGANRVQWFDYGPPRTSVAPRDATSRIYAVTRVK